MSKQDDSYMLLLVYGGNTLLANHWRQSLVLISFSAPVLREHERQDDMIQHMHPCRLYLESCLLFRHDVMCSVKFSDHGLLLVSSDQLGNTTGRSISVKSSYEVNRCIPWDSSTPSNPSPICTERHLVQ